jgi:ABC-type glycerol-3-phosphate transport system permease component
MRYFKKSSRYEFGKHATMVAFCLAIVLPLAWVLLLSFKSLPDAYNNQILPSEPLDFSHYGGSLSGIASLPRNIMNSLIVTLSTVAITVFASVLGGYALVHLRMRGRTLVLIALLVSLFLQVRVTGLIGVWEVQRQLGLLNRSVGLIPPYVTLTLALGIFIMRAVFQTVSKEIFEAASIDGANSWQALRHILFPLVTNGAIVVALMSFVTAWGEFLFAATFTWDRIERTLPVQLATVTGGIAEWSWPRIAAVYVMAVLPALILFTVLSRRYMDSVLEGASKG